MTLGSSTLRLSEHKTCPRYDIFHLCKSIKGKTSTFKLYAEHFEHKHIMSSEYKYVFFTILRIKFYPYVITMYIHN